MPNPIDQHWGMPPNREKALMLAQRDVSVFLAMARNQFMRSGLNPKAVRIMKE